MSSGIFHHFHHAWIQEISRALNGGLLPPGYYAMAEQIAGGLGPDVLAREIPQSPREAMPQAFPTAPQDEGDVAVATRPPRVRFHSRTDPDEVTTYARRAKAVVVRHTSGHRVVAVVELVSPGNQSSRAVLDSFVRKAREALGLGVHLLIVDLFPPGLRDPSGLHRALWEGEPAGDFVLPPDEPLACVAAIGGPDLEVVLEPVAVGGALPEMPLFLTPETYVPVPLDATYRAAWEAVSAVWRDALTSP